MNELGRQRLRDRRTDLGIGSRELSRRIDQSEVYVSEVERGKLKDVPLHVTERLARELGVSVGWLLGLDQPRGADDLSVEELLRALNIKVKEATEPPEEVRMIPRIKTRVSAGYSGFSEDETIPDSEIEEMVPGNPAYKGRKTAEAVVTGDCMAPRLMKGDKVEFEVGATARVGDLIVVRHNGEVMIKILGEHGLLLSRNYPPIETDETTRVLGVVLEARWAPTWQNAAELIGDDEEEEV